MSNSLLSLLPDLAARGDNALLGWHAEQPCEVHQFLARVAAWQTMLLDLSGQDFALYLHDSLEFGAALLAAWQAGKTIWLSADTLPATCLALEKKVAGFLGEFPAAFSPRQPAANKSANKSTNKPDIPLPIKPKLLDADFIGLVVHTSGSTGEPQAIAKRMAQLASEITSLEQVFGAKMGSANIFATVSHQHIYGLLFKLLWPLVAGRPLHAVSLEYPEQLLQHLGNDATNANAAVLVTSPAHLKRLPTHLDWQSVRQHLRMVFSSGGPLPAEIGQQCGRILGSVPFEVYGSSETGGIAWRQVLDHNTESWTPLPEVAWRIGVDTDGGQEVLQIQSPHLFDSHLLDSHWYSLADRARAHGQGFILSGRQDRLVKIEEKRISLAAIENLLQASPLVAQARVLLCPQVAGERQRVAAFIVTTQAGNSQLSQHGKLAMNRQLSQLLVDAIDAVALPRRWRYLEHMPTNAQGKTPQALLLALLDTRPRLPHISLLEQSAEKVALELVVPANLLYFDGHFQQMPILPGVVQVEWAIAYARQYFSLPADFIAMHALKFQHVIRPELPIRLELLHDAAKNSVNFRYLSPGHQHASGRILFAHPLPAKSGSNAT